MILAWYVGVCEHKRDELAENELIARGFEVHFPRSWSRERTHRGKMRMGYDLTHSPYFYIRFDGSSKDEYALAKRQRGIEHFLEIKPEVPGAVPDTLIEDHRARERAERAKIQVPRGKGRSDLILKAPYRIVSGPFKGQIGRMIDFGRGRAFLDINHARIEVSDTEIDIVKAEKKSA